MTFYPNTNNEDDYSKIEQEYQKVSDFGNINGGEIIDSSLNPFFKRCDFTKPSIWSISDTSDVAQTIIPFNNNLYIPLSNKRGFIKLNTESDQTYNLITHPIYPTNVSSQSTIVSNFSYCLTPQNLLMGSLDYKGGLPTHTFYVDLMSEDINTNQPYGKIKPISISSLSGDYVSGYSNIVYNKKLNTAFMMPAGDRFNQTSIWHKWDMSTNPPTLVKYNFLNGSGITYSSNEFFAYKYRFGVHTKNNRIFLIPSSMTPSAQSSKLHYIDCSGETALLREYSSGTFVSELNNTSSGGIYNGGVYVPHLDRIYMIPSAQLRKSNRKLHYINNCSTIPSIGSYTVTNGTGLQTTDFPLTDTIYSGGSYIGNGMIFLTPIAQATNPYFHLIDTNTNQLLPYKSFLKTTPYNEKSATFLTASVLYGDRIYFSYYIPVSNQTQWFYLNLCHNKPISKEMTTHWLKLSSH